MADQAKLVFTQAPQTMASIPPQMEKRPTRPSRLRVLYNLKFFAVFLIPFMFIWIRYIKVPDGYDIKTMSCVYVLVVTALYWILDCMPLAAASCAPFFLTPLLKNYLPKKLADNYMLDVNMVTFCSSIIVLGAVISGLGKRITWKIFAIASSDLRHITYYIMIVSTLFSMWFVNTAVMIFMLSVVENILEELKQGVPVGTLGDAKMQEFNSAKKDVDDLLAITEEAKKKVMEKEIQPVIGELGEVDSDGFEANEVIEVKEKKSMELEKGLTKDGAEENKYEENLDDPLMSQKAEVPNTLIANAAPFEEPKTARLTAINEEIKNVLDAYQLTLYHCIAIASNVGGLFWSYTSTSSPALFYKEPSNNGTDNTSINNALWMNFTFPIIVITLPLVLLNMEIMHFQTPSLFQIFWKTEASYLEKTAASPETTERIMQLYKEKYASLGKFTSHEKGILTLIFTTIVGLLLRNPEFWGGWADGFRKGIIVSDSTLTALAVLVGFLVPKCGTDMLRGPKGPKDKASFTALIGWKQVQQTFPWGILLFIGAGTVMAAIIKESKLQNLAANNFFELFNKLNNPPIALLISILFTVAFSNTLGNTVAAIVAVRVLGQVSSKLGYGSCYLSVPCVAVTSFAFLFPAGTPTMAIGYGKNYHLNTWYCFKKGWLLTIVCVIIVYLFGLFYSDILMYCG